MRSRVSIVMPCYNKEEFIGGMFDSILAQKWDNIELVLVNDGSTDSTRKIIDDYLPRFRIRGFQSITVDQENKGVPSAVYEGLKCVTGQFVCQLDADDEIEPDYVSEMAGWLDEHPEDDWVVCDSDALTWDFESQPLYKRHAKPSSYQRYPYKNLESFLLMRVARGTRHIMFRSSYMASCGMLDNFLIEPRVSQEAQLGIPLALGGSKPVYIRKVLHHYIKRHNSITRFVRRSYAEKLKWSTDYCDLIENTLSVRKNMNENDRSLMRVCRLLHEYASVGWYAEFNDFELSKRLIEAIRESEWYNDCITLEKARFSGFAVLARYFTNRVLGYDPQSTLIQRKGSGRFIAYPAYGQYAKTLTPFLVNSDIRPDVFWDIAAKDGDSISGIPVVKPDFGNVHQGDTALILSKRIALAKTVSEQFNETPARDNVWFYYDVLDHLAENYYGRI